MRFIGRREKDGCSLEQLCALHAETVQQIRALLHALAEQQRLFCRMLPQDGIFSGDGGSRVAALLSTHVLNVEPMERALEMLRLRLSSLSEDGRALCAAALQRGRVPQEEEAALARLEEHLALLAGLCGETLSHWRRESMRAADLEGEGKHASPMRLSALSGELASAYDALAEALA